MLEEGQAPRSRVGRNVIIMVMTFAGNYLASFATFPYLTRVLGPDQFGMLAYAMAMATYATLLTEWGFNLGGPKAVVECKGDARSINALIRSIAGAKACLCAISFVALAVLISFDKHIAASASVMFWSWLGVVANVFTLYWLFQGMERFHLIAAMVIVNRVVTLPLTFLFVHGPGDVAIAAAIQSAGPLVAALFSVAIALRFGVLRWPAVSVRAVVQRLKDGADMFVSTASVSLFGVANTVILASFSGTYQVGLYAAADKIRTVGNMVPAQLAAVLYPRITSTLKTDPKAAARLTLIGAAVTVLISIGGVACISLFSDIAIRIVLGTQYGGASKVLVVLCCSTLFGNLAYFLGLQVLVPFGESRKRSLVMLGAGCFNVGMALILVPRFGAMGAAVSLLIAEAIVLAAYLVSIACADRGRRYFQVALSR